MAQFVVPASDAATGGWSSTPLWSKIEETIASADGTEITSANNSSPDDADFTTTNPTNPDSGSHILRAHWRKSAASGHSINAILELYQGDPAGAGTLVATLSVSPITSTSLTTDSYTLSGAEVGNISDYSNLYFRLSRQGDTGGNPNSRRSLVVDAIELEVPDAASQQFNQSCDATASVTASITKDTTLSAKASTANVSASLTKQTSPTAFSASASAVATQDAALIFLQSAPATVSATADLTTSITFAQTAAAVVSATASLTKKTLKALSVTASATVGLAKRAAKTLGASVSAVSALGTEFTAGGGGGGATYKAKAMIRALVHRPKINAKSDMIEGDFCGKYEDTES